MRQPPSPPPATHPLTCHQRRRRQPRVEEGPEVHWGQLEQVGAWEAKGADGNLMG